MRNITDDSIQEIVTGIVNEFHPAAIYLFGSRSRGEAQETSDIDLLVISREPFTPGRSRQKELALLWRFVAQYRLPVDLLLYSQKELEEWRLTPGHVIALALNEGRELYAAA